MFAFVPWLSTTCALSDRSRRLSAMTPMRSRIGLVPVRSIDIGRNLAPVAAMDSGSPG
jgi:hypothetical protein